MEYYAAEKKKELIPFETALMELESIMLSEFLNNWIQNNYLILENMGSNCVFPFFSEWSDRTSKASTKLVSFKL